MENIDLENSIVRYDLLNNKINLFQFKPIDNLISILKREPQKKLYPNAKRNAPCPCGSGKKYKKCCINKIQEEQQ